LRQLLQGIREMSKRLASMLSLSLGATGFCKASLKNKERTCNPHVRKKNKNRGDCQTITSSSSLLSSNSCGSSLSCFLWLTDFSARWRRSRRSNPDSAFPDADVSGREQPGARCAAAAFGGSAKSPRWGMYSWCFCCIIIYQYAGRWGNCADEPHEQSVSRSGRASALYNESICCDLCVLMCRRKVDGGAFSRYACRREGVLRALPPERAATSMSAKRDDDFLHHIQVRRRMLA